MLERYLNLRSDNIEIEILANAGTILRSKDIILYG